MREQKKVDKQSAQQNIQKVYMQKLRSLLILVFIFVFFCSLCRLTDDLLAKFSPDPRAAIDVLYHSECEIEMCTLVVIGYLIKQKKIFSLIYSGNGARSQYFFKFETLFFLPVCEREKKNHKRERVPTANQFERNQVTECGIYCAINPS
uniref:(northern house mosquito) hypothetical protein n=1 Tax=Culex pipiens TaxID=7175 RepID=A0A8D8CWV8_CULPI